MAGLVPAELPEIMQCPACAGPLQERPEPPALVCDRCGLAYPVADGVPTMIVDEATPTGEAS